MEKFTTEEQAIILEGFAIAMSRQSMRDTVGEHLDLSDEELIDLRDRIFRALN